MERRKPDSAARFLKYRNATDGVLLGLASVPKRLNQLLRPLNVLLADEHFLNLLRAEGLTKMPQFIRERMKDRK